MRCITNVSRDVGLETSWVVWVVTSYCKNDYATTLFHTAALVLRNDADDSAKACRKISVSTTFCDACIAAGRCTRCNKMKDIEYLGYGIDGLTTNT